MNPVCTSIIGCWVDPSGVHKKIKDLRKRDVGLHAVQWMDIVSTRFKYQKVRTIQDNFMHFSGQIQAKKQDKSRTNSNKMKKTGQIQDK